LKVGQAEEEDHRVGKTECCKRRVKKLKEVDFIREIPKWLLNVVMVKTPNGK